MKHIKLIGIFTIALLVLNANAQEKKIKFNKGTLKICSSKNFQIEGYEGDEVIIKSLHIKRNSTSTVSYSISGSGYPGTYALKSNSKNLAKVGVSKTSNKNGPWIIGSGVKKASNSEYDSIFPKSSRVIFNSNNAERKNGLKKLGLKNENSDLGIYFIIEQNTEELVFKDNSRDQLVMLSNESYLIKIPNSLKLDWQTNNCENKVEPKSQYVFYNPRVSGLSNFDGEVSISSTLNNTKLIDVTGPVSINTIGGNVTVEFDKKMPKNLYSIYSNNGFIDITIPENSNINIHAKASDIFSDINFNIDEDKEEKNLQSMQLKLKSGKVKMKLDAGFGNIYLRKK
jgi:hypothetical protein